jgi:hypothetical protein
MAFQTRFASAGFTVGMRLMARETVAVETLARLATWWMSRFLIFAGTVRFAETR